MSLFLGLRCMRTARASRASAQKGRRSSVPQAMHKRARCGAPTRMLTGMASEVRPLASVASTNTVSAEKISQTALHLEKISQNAEILGCRNFCIDHMQWHCQTFVNSTPTRSNSITQQSRKTRFLIS